MHHFIYAIAKIPIGSISNWQSCETEKASGELVGINLNIIWWAPADNFDNVSPDEPTKLINVT